MTSVVPRMGHRSVWRPMIRIVLAAWDRFDPAALKVRVIERHTRRIWHQSEIGNLKSAPVSNCNGCNLEGARKS